MFDRLDTDPADAVGGGGPDETWVDRECPFDDDEDAPPLPEDVEFVEPSAGEWLESACAMRPGAGLLDALGEVVLSDVSADEAVTMLQEMQRVAAHVAGLEAALRAQVTAKVVAEVQEKIAADADPDRPARPQFVAPEQAAWSEVTAALRLSPVTGQAWLESPLNNNPVFRFIIAGPDDGDLEKLLPLVKQSNNIEYVGPIYGEQKEAWLRKSIFYVMPSLLEGFATSVLEAASRASIPVITPECNFPEIVEAGYAIETGTEKEKIKESLIRCSKMTDMEINKMAKGARQFISENYSIDIITNRLYTLYANLLNT